MESLATQDSCCRTTSNKNDQAAAMDGGKCTSENAVDANRMTPNECDVSGGKERLMTWINKQMKIEMTDGRVLIGVFLCSDRDGNVILGSCSEFLTEACGFFDEPRMLGLVMVPGRHIVTIHHAPNNVEGETT